MAIISEQESWERGILDKRDLKQGRRGFASKISYGGSHPSWGRPSQRGDLIVPRKETQAPKRRHGGNGAS